MKKHYRKNVAIVVFNESREILLCERLSPANSWQFPQGGVDHNEEIEAAAYRELEEETSIKSVKTVAILRKPIIYEFPEDIRKNLWKHEYNKNFYGQEQHWILMYFYGKNNEINLQTKIPEFTNFAWKDKYFAIDNIVDFKKESYEKALALLEPYILKYRED